MKPWLAVAPKARRRLLAAGACLLLGAFVVARAILVPFTYDEAASYLRYISRDVLSVFSFEVATNHFLNTFLTKLVSIAAGDSELALRVPSLIGYGAYLCFSILILRDIAHRPIAIAGFVLLNLNPYLLDYFALSRGYGLSLGLLMGAVFHLLRFVAGRRTGETSGAELSRALAFGCGAVLAGFSLLDAYLGLIAVAFLAVATVGWGRSRPSPSVIPGTGERWSLSWSSLSLPVVAAIFTFLVLSQDARLSAELYEPVAVSIAGLTEPEAREVKVSGIDLRRRPHEMPRAADGSVWRLDPPSAVQGLRIELPAGVAEKIDGTGAFIETVIGNRPFLQRRGNDDLWTNRDAGGTMVFDSGPALSLAKSRMAQHAPVINWRGDGKHLAVVARSTAVVLGLLAGLALALWVVGWILTHGRLVAGGDWRVLMIGTLWLAALAGTPVYLLRRSEELYFGGTRGLIEDTIYSLIENSFYGRTYFGDQTTAVFAVAAGSVVVFAVVVFLSYRRRAAGPVVPAACVLGIIVVTSAAVVAQHRVFDAPFLLSRTALFYIPLFMLFAVFACDAMARLGRAGRTMATALIVVAAALSAGHFAMTANVSYTWDWKKDAATKAMVDDLTWIINAERPPGSRIILGVEPTYSAAAAFYSQKVRTVTIEMDTLPTPRTVDFFYVDERNVGLMQVVKRYPVANSVLARPPGALAGASGRVFQRPVDLRQKRRLEVLVRIGRERTGVERRAIPGAVDINLQSAPVEIQAGEAERHEEASAARCVFPLDHGELDGSLGRIDNQPIEGAYLSARRR
ncbi:MAG TPA: hypothetical protein VES67_03360 [Vicinamibacterales bacterium]|nr:hypothetical protein [Vicinamibacterales bacterium]